MGAPDESTPHDKTATFKDELDRKALEEREREQPPRVNPVVGKITEFIPAAAKVLGPKEKAPRGDPPVAGPPERPDDDASIETFVRHQYKSQQPGGDLNSVAGK